MIHSDHRCINPCIFDIFMLFLHCLLQLPYIAVLLMHPARYLKGSCGRKCLSPIIIFRKLSLQFPFCSFSFSAVLQQSHFACIFYDLHLTRLKFQQTLKMLSQSSSILHFTFDNQNANFSFSCPTLKLFLNHPCRSRSRSKSASRYKAPLRYRSPPPRGSPRFVHKKNYHQ